MKFTIFVLSFALLSIANGHRIAVCEHLQNDGVNETEHLDHQSPDTVSKVKSYSRIKPIFNTSKISLVQQRNRTFSETFHQALSVSFKTF